jgi:phage gp36-like protein
VSAYITQSDLEAAFSAAEIADLDASGNSVRAAREVVSRLLDSVAGRWYALPLSSIGSDAKAFLCDLARYHLYTNGAPEIVQARADLARAWLAKVAAGQVVLLGADGAPLAQAVSQTTLPAVGARTLTFGSEFSERYKDPEQWS